MTSQSLRRWYKFRSRKQHKRQLQIPNYFGSVPFVRLVIITLCCASAGYGQDQKDLGDLFRTNAPTTIAEPGLRTLYLPILPIIGYAPANGFLVGAGIAPAILLDSAQYTHISTGLANVQLTSKEQVNFNFRHFIYLSHDRWIFQGDWRLLLFTQSTYGLGIQDVARVFALNGLNLTQVEAREQPMRFTYIRVYETALTKVSGRWYAGFGAAIDYHTNIVDERLQLETEPRFLTSHYLFSQANGFSKDGYAANGLVAKVLFDSRDNSTNAYSGTYLDVGLRLNQRWLGSTKSSTQFLFEFRNYQRIGNTNNRIAFWLIGQFLPVGSLPYLALPAIGWDTYNRSGRGYIQGRFRGENLAYSEIEFRYNISRNGLLGGVGFVNATSVDNTLVGQNIFKDFAFGYGAGLRLKMNKETRTNLCVDIGLGQNQSAGIYFGIQEAF